MKVSNIGLRLLEPACPLNEEWTRIPVKEQATSVVQLLSERSVPDPVSDPDRETELFDASTFVYIYYILAVVLRNGGELVGSDELTVSRALKMIINHAQMRKTKSSNSVSITYL